MDDNTIERLADEYLRQERTNTMHLEAMCERHEEEKNSLIRSIEEGPSNPWNAAFRELGIKKTSDLIEQVAERLRNRNKVGAV